MYISALVPSTILSHPPFIDVLLSLSRVILITSIPLFLSHAFSPFDAIILSMGLNWIVAASSHISRMFSESPSDISFLSSLFVPLTLFFSSQKVSHAPVESNLTQKSLNSISWTTILALSAHFRVAGRRLISYYLCLSNFVDSFMMSISMCMNEEPCVLLR